MDFRVAIARAVCLLAFVALPAAAALYKWTDENGRVVYGDTPPPGVTTTRVDPMLPPADPKAVQEMAAKDQQLNKRLQERAADEAKAQKAEAEARAKLDRCVQLRGRLQTLRGGVPLYKFDDKGAKVYYTPAEVDQAIAETEKLLTDQECPSAPAG